MPDYDLEYTAGVNTDEVDILYTDTAGGTPDTVIETVTGVSAGAQSYRVTAPPVGRRYAVRPRNTVPDPDLDGALSNIVEVPDASADVDTLANLEGWFSLRNGGTFWQDAAGGTLADGGSEPIKVMESGGAVAGVATAPTDAARAAVNATRTQNGIASFVAGSGDLLETDFTHTPSQPFFVAAVLYTPAIAGNRPIVAHMGEGNLVMLLNGTTFGSAFGVVGAGNNAVASPNSYPAGTYVLGVRYDGTNIDLFDNQGTGGACQKLALTGNGRSPDAGTAGVWRLLQNTAAGGSNSLDQFEIVITHDNLDDAGALAVMEKLREKWAL